MLIVRSGEWRPAPWKNGGGVTNEIAVAPPGADMGSFNWRISAARVERAGAFSSFPHIERTLCVLDGAGIILTGPSIGAVTLTEGSTPFSFAADTLIDADLVAGTVLDLNVMSRRGLVPHRVEKLRLLGDHVMRIATGTLALFNNGGRVVVESGAQRVVLERFDSVMAAGPVSLTLSAEIGTPLIAVWLDGAARKE